MKDRLKNNKVLFGIIFLGILAFVLPITLILVRDTQDQRSSASAPDKLETEGGVLSSNGVSKQSDSGASGGSYVLFNKQTPSNTPSPTRSPTSGELKAFPSAEGWGKNATGGRGGDVRKVTNLNNSGTGSLRAAWEASGKATIIFEVAGTISVSSAIRATGDKTIAGETAFRNNGQGITIKRDGSFGDSAISGNMNNTIIRYIRSRPGPTNGFGECCGDALTATGTSQNIIIDHSSFSWSTDETINFWGPTRYITLQNNIISEPLILSTHMEDGVYQSHGFAFLSGGSDTNCANSTSHLTFFNNLFAHSDGRNPAIGGICPEAEQINTLLYNWGHFGSTGARAGKKINMINHYTINGKDTSTGRYSISVAEDGYLYVRGIYNHKNNFGSLDDWAGIGCEGFCGGSYQKEPAPASWQIITPYNYPMKDYPKMTKEEILNEITQNTGANLNYDSVDQRILKDVTSGGSSGSFIDHPNEVGGWPILKNMSSVPQDSDNDGMPDSYEDSRGLNKNNSADGRANSGDGYTNLEKYLFSLTGDI